MERRTNRAVESTSCRVFAVHFHVNIPFCGTTSHCRIISFVFFRKDKGKEILSPCEILRYLLESSRPVIDADMLAKCSRVSEREWLNYVDNMQGSIVTAPGKVYSIDDLTLILDDSVRLCTKCGRGRYRRPFRFRLIDQQKCRRCIVDEKFDRTQIISPFLFYFFQKS